MITRKIKRGRWSSSWWPELEINFSTTSSKDEDSFNYRLTRIAVVIHDVDHHCRCHQSLFFHIRRRQEEDSFSSFRCPFCLF
jgi:hypothetical protein